MELWEILTAILSLITILFGVWIYNLKNALAQAKVVIDVILQAMEDSTITKEELEKIAQEIQKMIDLFKAESVDIIKKILNKKDF